MLLFLIHNMATMTSRASPRLKILLPLGTNITTITTNIRTSFKLFIRPIFATLLLFPLLIEHSCIFSLTKKGKLINRKGSCLYQRLTVRRLAKRKPFSRQPILFIFPTTSLCKDCIPPLFIGKRDDFGFSVYNKIMTGHLDTREKVGESLMQLHCRVRPTYPRYMVLN